ncbi:MAG: HPF/RaiA family ribosome-associated protein [Parcubacteria group bacterium]
MNVNFYFHKVDESCKKQIENYFNKEKLSRVERLLHHGNAESAELKVKVEYFLHHSEFFAKLILNIPRHEVVAEKRSFKLLEALDMALDRLVLQLRKIENIRHKK